MLRVRRLSTSSAAFPSAGPTGQKEVAEFVAFLASNRAASIHGSDYTIDGGTVPTTLSRSGLLAAWLT